jgi:hypothetical protein
MGKRLKSVPAFASEAEERTFWQTHDSADYVDWSKAQRVVLPNLKPTTNTISLRFPNICSTPSRPQPTRATCRISR